MAAVTATSENGNGSETVVQRAQRRAPVWTALILLASLTGCFALLTLVLDHNHAWTDALMRLVPGPGIATSLAVDPALVAQLRIEEPSARLTSLADRTVTLVAEARVVNDALIPVSNVILEAVVFEEDRPVGHGRGHCGRNVSERLLQRLPLPELMALGNLADETLPPLAAGGSALCQVAIPMVSPAVDEVSIRIASVEPLPGHRPRRFHRAE